MPVILNNNNIALLFWYKKCICLSDIILRLKKYSFDKCILLHVSQKQSLGSVLWKSCSVNFVKFTGKHLCWSHAELFHNKASSKILQHSSEKNCAGVSFYQSCWLCIFLGHLYGTPPCYDVCTVKVNAHL